MSVPGTTLLLAARFLRTMGAGVAVVKKAEIHKLCSVLAFDIRWETILGDLLEMKCYRAIVRYFAQEITIDVGYSRSGWKQIVRQLVSNRARRADNPSGQSRLRFLIVVLQDIGIRLVSVVPVRCLEDFFHKEM